MKIAKLTLLILMFVLILAIFVANVANIIDVDSHALSKAATVEGTNDAESKWSKPRKYNIDDSPDHLLWFLQVSHIPLIYCFSIRLKNNKILLFFISQITDIHISIFRDQNRITELKEFCDITVSSIKPEVVLASGNNTSIDMNYLEKSIKRFVR